MMRGAFAMNARRCTVRNINSGSAAGVTILAIVLALTLILSYAAASWGQSGTSGQGTGDSPTRSIIFLLIPLGLSGDYAPLTKKDIHAIVESDMERRDPDIDVIVADTKDPRTGGVDITSDIRMSDVRKLAQSYGANFVCWGTTKFTYAYKVAQQGIVIEYLCTAQGKADVKVYDSKAQDIVIDQPMLQFKNGSTRAIEDSQRFNELRRELLEGCVTDLSQNLRKEIRKQIESRDSSK
jgi:hypothetical protein